ncbi:MAG: EF-P lysine aminoacylase EpmA [Patescibacteria group bacterium]
MNELTHLQKNKKNFELRFNIIRAIREFFWQNNFFEVETPQIVRLPGQEPHLSPMPIDIHDETKKKRRGYLHTSPEYAMKKMLAVGFENIFSICKCFRDYESFGGLHNPEFTMIEWYRANVDFWKIMDDIDLLLGQIVSGLKRDRSAQVANFEKCERTHMRDLWKKYAKADLDKYLEPASLRQLCIDKGYNAGENENYEDLFYRIFLNEIESHLGRENPQIVHHYPARMAALSKISDQEPKYAERFELYINGIELANAFSELTDPVEQLRRLEEEKRQREKAGKDVYDIDEEFIGALALMPPSAGIALGIDRLVQVFAGCKNIDDVLVLPASIIFKTLKH